MPWFVVKSDHPEADASGRVHGPGEVFQLTNAEVNLAYNIERISAGVFGIVVQEPVISVVPPYTGAKGFAYHGNNPEAARPKGYASIEWMGYVQPAYAMPQDTLVLLPGGGPTPDPPVDISELGIQRIMAYGHSLITGYMLTSPETERFTKLLANDAGSIPEVNRGVTSSMIAHEEVSHGGVYTVFANTKRPASSSFPGYDNVVVIATGANDIDQYGWDANALRYIKGALRSAIGRLLAGAVYDDQHASWSYDSNWVSATDLEENYSAGGTAHAALAAGAVATWTAPAGVDGHACWVNVSIKGDGASGATYTVRRNGSVVGTFDGTGGIEHVGVGGQVTPFSFRIPGCSAGDTITITSSKADTSNSWVDSAWVESKNPPVVLVLKGYKVNDYSALTGPIEVDDSGVDALNAAIDEVVADLPARVIAVDTSSLDKNPSLMASDGIHPNSGGHQLLAGLCASAISSSGYTASDASQAVIA